MPILTTWNTWIAQMAVFAGSATALLSLLWHAPVRTACLRGGIAWFGVVLVGRLVAWFLEKAETADRKQARAAQTKEPLGGKP